MSDGQEKWSVTFGTCTLWYHISYVIYPIIYHISYIIFHFSFFIYHISFFIYHMSYIIYHISFHFISYDMIWLYFCKYCMTCLKLFADTILRNHPSKSAIWLGQPFTYCWFLPAWSFVASRCVIYEFTMGWTSIRAGEQYDLYRNHFKLVKIGHIPLFHPSSNL